MQSYFSDSIPQRLGVIPHFTVMKLRPIKQGDVIHFETDVYQDGCIAI